MNKDKIKLYKNLNRGRWAMLKIDEVIEELPNNMISDVGAGFGWLGKFIEERKLECQVFDRLKKTQHTIIWDLNYPAPEGVENAGAIVMLEVIEHLDNPELALKNTGKHLAKGGFLIFSSPNPYSAKTKFSQLFFNQYYAFQPKHLIEHHVYIPLPHILDFHLNNEGFERREYGILQEKQKLQFEFKIRFLKNIIRMFLEWLLSLGSTIQKGNTQVFLYKKIID